MAEPDRILVETSSERYPITIGGNLAKLLRKELEILQNDGARLAVVTDENVFETDPATALFSEMLADIPRLVLPAGEATKSVDRYASVLEFFAANRLDRGSVAVAVGGGVIGDLCGFAAASWLRGIRYVQVPTTLLAMVDSSVGGKTGINLPAGKNLVGAFHQPIAVYADMDLLATLPPREFRAGMAEVIKYGLLGDGHLFEMLSAEPLLDSSDARLAAVVKRNCQTKARIVQADEKELAGSGGRALLNLGHTFAHAIENVAGYGEYLHGEAVAIGLVAAAKLSTNAGLCSVEVLESVRQTVEHHGLPIDLSAPLSTEALFEAMGQDKKVRAGRLRFVLLERIGRAVTRDDVSSDQVASAWRFIGSDG